MKIQFQENFKEKPKISCVVGLTTEPSRLLDLEKKQDEFLTRD